LQGGDDEAKGNLPVPSPPSSSQSHAAEAASLFSNVRIPAVLFAGASAGAAFALPIVVGEDTLKVGLVKRLYALLMIGALSSQLVVIVVATLALEAIAHGRHEKQVQQDEELVSTSVAVPRRRSSPSLSDFVAAHYELEWIATRVHFFAGVLAFALGSGIRAWIFVACPVVAKACLFLILSATTLAVAFLQENDGLISTSSSGVVTSNNSNKYLNIGNWLGIRTVCRYWRLLWGRAIRNPWFAAALVFSALTHCYILGNVRHVYVYLSR